jgi:rubredoxin
LISGGIKVTEKERVKCPRCGAEAKQFEIREQYKSHYEARGKYYCDKCGWLEGHDYPMKSLIRKQEKSSD